jgi:ABC-type molybdate transport system substrate-binding protein
MKRIAKILMLCFVAAMLAMISGCSAAKNVPERTITVFADTKFEKSFEALADQLYQADKIRIRFDFDDSQALSEKVRGGETADLLALDGMTPMDKLKKDKIIDNYMIFGREKVRLGTARYTMAKTLNSKDFADAQRFADLILSDEGKKIFAQYGYTSA